MKRRQFINKVGAATIATGFVGGYPFISNSSEKLKPNQMNKQKPLAITMWDFSWLERRWPGAGYENWDVALDELIVRGYNAIRIDVYPHLISNNPEKEYTILPVWNQNDWGSPDITKISVQPALNTFLSKCMDRKIKVGISSWYREDEDNIRMQITSAEKMAEIWLKTIQSIQKDNLLDTILYVDLCNEWPGDLWAPYFKKNPPQLTWGHWQTDVSMEFMKKSIEILQAEYPELPFCYSFDNIDIEKYEKYILDYFGLFEHHIWMVKENNNEFNQLVAYKFDRFSPESYENLVEKGEIIYRQRPDYWKKLLTSKIERAAKSAAAANQLLITSECWGIIDYKDWPLLNWNWVKDLCKLGAETASKTGQWAAIASSNFCGPQFSGMWNDLEWHQKITEKIKSGKINKTTQNQNLLNRLNY